MKLFLIDRLKNLSTTLLLFNLLLCVAGTLTVFSTTYTINNEVSQIFINHVLYYALGMGLLLIITCFDYRFLSRKSVVAAIYLVTIILLILVLIYGEIVFGTRRWLSFGGFTVQPSEFAKLCVVVLVGFSFNKSGIQNFKEIINFKKQIEKTTSERIFNILKIISVSRHTLISILVFVVVTLVLMQKSLGNTLLIIGIYVLLHLSVIKISLQNFLLIFSGVLGSVISFELINLEKFYNTNNIDVYFLNIDLIQVIIFTLLLYILSVIIKSRFRWSLLVFIIFLFSSLSLSLVYNKVLEEYQRGRIEAFLNPEEGNALSTDWNKIQSQTAIGSGQIFGKGFLKGTQVTFGLLPFPHTDFAYAAYAEQFGFFGSLILLVIYLGLMVKILLISKDAEDNLGRILCIGVFLIILLNLFQSIGMNMGILPISGVPLPLISYGGSAILTIFIGLGLVQSVNAVSKEKSGIVIKVEV